jgi:Tfp pilus assembly protein PilE
MNSLKHYGFGLLDVIVSVSLAAILSLLIFQALQQTRRTVKKIQATVDINSMLIHFKDRFFKDIQGSFIPQTPSKQQPQQQNQPTQAPAQPVEKKEQQDTLRYYVLERINITNKADADHGTLHFITTSSLNIYDAVAPRAVRVLYELKKQPDKKTWQLSRLESPELDYKKFSDIAQKRPGIIVLTNIESIEITCYAHKKQDKKQTAQPVAVQPQQQEEPAEQLASFNTWNSDERKKDKLSPLPEFIKITGSVKNENAKTPVEFSCMVPLEAVAGGEQKSSILEQLANLFPELQEKPEAQGKPSQGQQGAPAPTLFPSPIIGRR